MCYELAPKPPSLFNGALTRKTPKSTLANFLEIGTPLLESCPIESMYVVDGGHLLHQVVWPKPATYGQVCSAYVSFVVTHYGSGTTVVFDGYDGPCTTKNVELGRRTSRANCASVVFDLNTTVSASQGDFLSNAGNKRRLINQLIPKLNSVGICTHQAAADADTLIVSTALQKVSEGLSVVVVGTDTDLLALLVHCVDSRSKVFFLKPGVGQKPDKIYPVATICENIGGMKECILLAHAFPDCDKTSAIYKKGKNGPWRILEKNRDLQILLKIFYDSNADANDLASAGEKYFLKMYGGEKCKDLNELRYFMLKVSAKFDLAVPPPTSDAARL